MKKHIFSLALSALAILFAGTACVEEFDTVLNNELSTDTDVSEYMPVIQYGAVKLGTFNLLYGAYKDNDNYLWATRKTVLAEAIVANDFDIAGLQEVDRTIRQQLPDLVKAALPKESTRNYQYWFMNRDKQAADDQASLDAVGEGLGVMYDANKFTISDQHFFWLSPTPDVCSTGWDETSYRRMACCAVFTQNDNPDKRFFLMVTHAPLGATARVNSATILNERAAMYNTGNLAAFIVGDMNAAPDDPASAAFSTFGWKDAFKEVPAAAKTGGIITFHSKKDITDTSNAENRIDYIYYKNLPKVLSYTVDYNKYNGYYPSDHCAVNITFDIPDAAKPIPSGVKGTGTEEDPFKVGTVAEWKAVADFVNAQGANVAYCYKLTKDLVFSGDFTRITTFYGTLDGDGHSMKGITGEAAAEDFGGVINVLGENAVLKNLYVEATLSSAFKNLGGVVGKDTPGSIIDGVTFKGDLTGTGETSRIGGIIGTSYSVIVNCGCLGGTFDAGTATKSENMGGIAGRIEQNTAIMANCYSFLDKIVSSNNNLGGVTGGLGTNAYCVNVYGTTTDITGGGTFGGCIGYSKSGNIRNVYTSDEANGKWVANDKQASDWPTTGASLPLANMKSGAVTLPSSGVSYDSFVAALNAGIEDWNAIPSIAALTGDKTAPIGIVNKPDVTLREWKVGANGYPVVSTVASSGGSGEEGPIGDPITVAIVFKDYAAANGWIDGTDPNTATEIHTLVEQNGVKIVAGGNDGQDNGVYNAPSYYDWRFYQARGGKITISVPNGFRLVSVTFDYYEYKNGGLMLDPDGNQCLDETEMPVSGQEATFVVGNMEDKTNGQARILGITVKYVGWGTTNPDPGTGGGEPTAVDIDVVTFGTDNNWVADGSVSYNIEKDGVKLTASWNDGGSMNGVFYGTDWRFYQARGGGITVEAPAGKQLVKAKFKYNIKNTGIIIAPDGATQVPSDTECDISGSSVMFTVGNSGTATNGQARITNIVITYK